jgi:hypothetical protein
LRRHVEVHALPREQGRLRRLWKARALPRARSTARRARRVGQVLVAVARRGRALEGPRASGAGAGVHRLREASRLREHGGQRNRARERDREHGPSTSRRIPFRPWRFGPARAHGLYLARPQSKREASGRRSSVLSASARVPSTAPSDLRA